MKIIGYKTAPYILVLFVIAFYIESVQSCIYYKTDKAASFEAVHQIVIQAERALENIEATEEELEELIYLLRIFKVTEQDFVIEEPASPLSDLPGLETNNVAEEEPGALSDAAEDDFEDLFQELEQSGVEQDSNEAVGDDNESTGEEVQESVESDDEPASIETGEDDEESAQEESDKEQKLADQPRAYIESMDRCYDQLIATNPPYQHYQDFFTFRNHIRKLSRALYLKKIELILKRNPSSSIEARIYCKALSGLDKISLSIAITSEESRRAQSLVYGSQQDALTDIVTSTVANVDFEGNSLEDTEATVSFWKNRFLSSWEIGRSQPGYTNFLIYRSNFPDHVAQEINARMSSALYNLAMTYYVMSHYKPPFAARLLREICASLPKGEVKRAFPQVRIVVATFPSTIYANREAWTYGLARTYLEHCLGEATLPLSKKVFVVLNFAKIVFDPRILKDPDPDCAHIQSRKALMWLKCLSKSTELTGDTRIRAGLQCYCSEFNNEEAREKIAGFLSLCSISGAPEKLKRAAALLAIRLADNAGIDFIADEECLRIVQYEYDCRNEPLDTPFYSILTTGEEDYCQFIENDIMLSLTLINFYRKNVRARPANFSSENQLRRLLGIASDRSVRCRLHTLLGDYFISLNRPDNQLEAYLNYHAALSLAPSENDHESSRVQQDVTTMIGILNKIVRIFKELKNNSFAANEFVKDLIDFYELPCPAEHYYFHSSGCPKDFVRMPLFIALLNDQALVDFEALVPIALKVIDRYPYDETICSAAEYEHALSIVTASKSSNVVSSTSVANEPTTKKRKISGD